MARVLANNGPRKATDVESHLLDEDQFASVVGSFNHLFRRVQGRKIAPSMLWGTLGRGGPDLRLMLLPLDRVGSEQGVGGTKVLAGYFAHGPESAEIYSRPLIIKIAKAPVSGRRRGTPRDKLEDERQRARSIAKYTRENEAAFALPFHFDAAGDGAKCSVLWALLQSCDPFKRLAGPTMAAPPVYELCKILRGYD